MTPPSTVAVVAEKPSVARDIARVLKASTQGQGFLHGNGYVVTWAIGHLVALAQPHEIRPEWRSWRLDRLPMLPTEWPLVVGDQTRDQFEVVRKILTSPKIASVICATDAGREGELIFRYIYEAAGSDKPVERLWISSLTPEAIREGLAKVRSWDHYHSLADAARGRSRADWLVGMNLSRAYTLTCGEDISVGRVQTPTLAMIAERELAIRQFVPENYFQVIATFSPAKKQTYEGTWFRPAVDPLEAATRLPADGEEAKTIVARVQSGQARIEKISAQTKRMSPPGLYDLTELQRHANRLYGFSAQRTLDIAQALYERHKLISYPRTDSRHLSQDVARTLPRIVNSIAGNYQGLLAPGTGERPLSKRFVDDAKVSDHHAIIPTGASASSLGGDEQKIYDLICRRLLSAWHDDYIWAVTTVITLVTSGPPEVEDRFHSTGTAVQQEGWKVLDIGGGKKRKTKSEDAGDDSADGGQTLPPGLETGQPQSVEAVDAVEKKTRPPKRFSEATLLTAMETAGKTLDDKELSDAMKENGLGTPATRAQIIEVLLKREFIQRNGKSLEATDKGLRLIDIVHPEVKSPAMTGQWEAFLKRIERGQEQLPPFISGIEEYVREVIGKVGTTAKPSSSRPWAPAADEQVEAAPVALAPRKTGGPLDLSPDGLREVLTSRFKFPSFRPNQEAVCQALTAGQDVLLVMPTGSGKSLCYQLPGIALGGTTLVISPLIALMEDQVAKMNALGFAAERIHSSRNRIASREACFAYLEGKLDFLFIAPERLRVQGFPEMLAKRKPCLIAIDEAHCISQWGHDFRPDYRTIGQHLPALRPAPVIALTATATPNVQHDIARQLDLATPRHFIHGFRRDNIAIEVVRAPQSARPGLTMQILEVDEHRPAIVYVPKRRDAETLATQLNRRFPTKAYHAGLEGSTRHSVQSAFLSGQLEVIVATIAFGMGIDKPDVRTVIHTALPSSLEGYYQEMGRAGRDGKPSRAILMHAYSDRYTHDFFYERDYPEPDVLAGIFDVLTAQPQEKEYVRSRSRLNSDAFDTALEKLWIHGGAIVDYAENISQGTDGWRELYIAQREHKMSQFERMMSYCDLAACRMTSLVKYFGDTGDSRRPCGTCDFCSPDTTVGRQSREPSTAERQAIADILEELKTSGTIAMGRLYSQVYPEAQLDRRGFEDILEAMARAALVQITEATFEKDGRTVPFRKVHLTRDGMEAGEDLSVLMPVELAAVPRASRASKSKKKKEKVAAAPKAAPKPAAKAARKARKPAPVHTGEPVEAPRQQLPARAALIESAIRAWRVAEAKKKGVPAFRILTDRVVRAIAESEPTNTHELLAVPGITLSTVEKYGATLFRLLQRAE
jgi:DNA topoisomerase-3